MSGVTINLAARVPVTEAEGPGRRFAIWVQGCPFRCPGCCNPQFLEFRPAEEITVAALLQEIEAVAAEIEGITLIGGEPFAQASPLAELTREVRARNLSVMVFSGYQLEKLQDPAHADAESRTALLAQCDLLVDGLYRQDQPDPRRWIGSRNQRIHFLTARYQHLQDDWDNTSNTIELRLRNGELLINGFPHKDITELSRLRTLSGS